MTIEVKKMYYNTTTDTTTIIFLQNIFPKKKSEEKLFVMKGRFLEKPTVYNVTKFLEENL
jgi:hypothetical protein